MFIEIAAAVDILQSEFNCTLTPSQSGPTTEAVRNLNNALDESIESRDDRALVSA